MLRGFETLTKSFIAAYALIMLATSVYAQDEPQSLLPWAYALNAPGVEPERDDGMPKHVPGSQQAFTMSEIGNLYGVPDWHPDDHPKMPGIVAHGREPGVYACSYCHLPNGQGRPENASLAGLSAAYIVQQMADYKAGLRRSSEPQSLPASYMLAIGATATEREVADAAAYFSSLTPQRWIRVIETDTVPETTVVGWIYAPVVNGGVEPIGQRIIEMPEDFERTELRDSRSSFIAFVPTGSGDKGKHLVRSGGNGKRSRAQFVMAMI